MAGHTNNGRRSYLTIRKLNTLSWEPAKFLPIHSAAAICSIIVF